MAALLLAQPLFGQIFHYMTDLPPLWALSKAFLLLSLPLALVLLRRPRAPMTRQVLFTFLWVMLVPSFAGVFYFGQDFFTGLGAEVKLLPLLYFFSFLGLLLHLRPSLGELRASFMICGVATLVALVVLWVVIPEDWYAVHYVQGSAPLFSRDGRGLRIRMPMYFAIVALFYCYRRFLEGWRARWLLGAAVTFGLTLGVVRTRSMIVGIAGVVALNGFLRAGPALRLVLLLLIPVALVGLFSVGYLGGTFSTAPGSGFDVRWQTATQAVNFLGTDPLRWLFGVGTISPLSSDSLISYFNHFFFLADITWLGVLFEFGLVGSLLILLFQLRGLVFYAALAPRLDSTFLRSLFDYLVYVLLISGLYPPTLTPGETAVILAIFAYVWQRLEREPPAAVAEIGG